MVKDNSGKEKPVKILILEDEPFDAELIRLELEKSKLEIRQQVVSDRELFRQALDKFDPEVILSDYNLPGFCGLEAMEIVNSRSEKRPFILVSGSLGEERAIDAMKRGATDYVLKERLNRLIPAVERAVAEFRELMERKLAEAALAASEERYELAVQGANDGIWDWDIVKDNFYFSPRWKSILGYNVNDITGDPREWFGRIHPEDEEQVRKDLDEHLSGRTENYQNEHRLLRSDSTYCWVLCRGVAVKNGSGQFYRMAGSMTDISKRKQIEEQLSHDAFHDSLTGLPNRTLFLDRLGRSIEQTHRKKKYLFAVLFLDFDDFKIVNDSLGHLVGDQLLVAITQRLQACLFPGDTLARLGGDEFAILLDDLNNFSDATRVAERIQDVVSKPFNLDNHEVFSSVSIGIACSTSSDISPENLLRDADTAMYRAKCKGKSQYILFDSNMHFEAKRRLQLESDLRKALQNNEFTLHYQPIVSLETRELCGYEALIRWKHPDNILVPPDEFIFILEETGLINSVGLWVVENACQQLNVWQTGNNEETGKYISINLSAKQFLQMDFIYQIQRIVRDMKIKGENLKFEITETMVMENVESAIEILAELKKLGALILMDDFGTGYSSLSCLRQFPIDIIKIDRSFVSFMHQNNENFQIIKTIITLAKNLHLEVVAEGIENVEQMETLQNLGCEYGQGYYFSKPIPAPQLDFLPLNQTPSQLNSLNYAI